MDNPAYPRSANQSKPADGDNSRKWYATNSVGGGYYYDVAGTEKPVPNIHDQGNPYVVPGLFAVLMTVGSPVLRAKAQARIYVLPNASDVVNANSDYDPNFNGAVSNVLSGSSVENVFNYYKTNVAGVVFTQADLQRAKDTADSL